MWLRTSNSRAPWQGLAGTTIGNYRLLRELGHDPTGTVFEARHERIGRLSAVKVLRGPLGGDPDLSQRALSEAQAIGLIDHPGIVSIYDCLQVDGVGPAIVMELLHGERLSDHIKRQRPLPWHRAARLARRIAAALAAAHGQGIAHLDLTPQNIMLVPDADAMDGERVKVMDFGLAHILAGTDSAGRERREQGTDPETGVLLLLGSPRYMAPEQCKGGCPVDSKADVYALGVMLYEMLAGLPPFAAESRGELLALHILGPVPPLAGRPGVPGALAELVQRMLAKDPRERPAMSEVERLLDLPPAVAAHAPPTPPPPDEWEVQTDVSLPPGPAQEFTPVPAPDRTAAEVPTLVEEEAPEIPVPATAAAAVGPAAGPPPSLGFSLGSRQQQREMPLLLVSTLVVLAFLAIAYAWSSLKERPATPQHAAAAITAPQKIGH